jgi:hypothetical protein
MAGRAPAVYASAPANEIVEYLLGAEVEWRFLQIGWLLSFLPQLFLMHNTLP